MAEDLKVLHAASKAEKYAALLPQLEAILETDLIANLANMAAALKETFGFFWVGFYLVKAEQLVLGPFQGPVACTRIPYGKGVCGAAWQQGQTILVPDVAQFPGHIACSSLSKSEVVVPLFSGVKVWGVLDVDSDQLNDFDHTDVQWLERFTQLLSIEPDHQ